MIKHISYVAFLVVFFNIQLAAQVQIHKNDYDTLDIDNNMDFSTFTNLDSITLTKKIFLIGENHQYRYSNSKLQLKMLKYLNRYAGVNNWVMEFGYPTGYLIDNYINNDEDSVLTEILERYFYSEYMNLFKEVRKYNLELPENEQINVYGLDVERSLKLSTSLLAYLLPDTTIPKPIIVSVEALRGLVKYNDIKQDLQKEKFDLDDIDKAYSRSFYSSRYFSANKTMETFILDYDKNDSLFKDYLGVNYEVFNKVIDEIRSYLEYNSYSSQTYQYAFRENYIYNNFENIFLKDTTQKFFGQFGRCHVAKINQDEACSWYDYVSFAAKVFKSNEVTLNSIITFGIIYPKYNNIETTLSNEPEILELLDSFPQEGTYALNLNKYKYDFEYIGEYYDYLIINNKDLSSESDSLKENDVYYKTTQNDLYFSIHFSYIFNNYEISNLNNYLFNLNFPKINPSLTTYGLSFSLGNNNGFIYTTDFIFFEKENSSNNLEDVELTGSAFTIATSYDLLASKNFLLAPRVGIGAYTYQLVFEQNDNNPNAITNQFGDKKTVTYTNPAFVMDAGLDFAFTIVFAELGIFGRYRADFSKKEWINSDLDLIQNSPKTNHNSIMYGIRLGLAF